MSIPAAVNEWWVKALLGEADVAHPVFGEGVAQGRKVVNRVSVVGPQNEQHLQTIIGIFPNEEQAKLACQTATSWEWRGNPPPLVVSAVGEAER